MVVWLPGLWVSLGVGCVLEHDARSGRHGFHAQRTEALPRPSAQEVSLFCQGDHWSIHLIPSERVAEATLVVEGPDDRGFAQPLVATTQGDHQLFLAEIPILEEGSHPTLSWQTSLRCSPVDGVAVRAWIELGDERGQEVGCTALAHRRGGCDTLLEQGPPGGS
ncbi:MAG TPA: hypothetical protein ENK18_08795 [Deltaproteobacteria bacterium]|nr:hypothetical protein [Deltaproteobacteria bacterium]